MGSDCKEKIAEQAQEFEMEAGEQYRLMWTNQITYRGCGEAVDGY